MLQPSGHSGTGPGPGGRRVAGGSSCPRPQRRTRATRRGLTSSCGDRDEIFAHRSPPASLRSSPYNLSTASRSGALMVPARQPHWPSSRAAAQPSAFRSHSNHSGAVHEVTAGFLDMDDVPGGSEMTPANW